MNLDSVRRKSSSLLDDVRRLSDAGSSRTSKAFGRAGPSLDEDWNDLVKRLVRDDVRDITAVEALMLIWRKETFEHANEQEQLRMYRELVRA